MLWKIKISTNASYSDRTNQLDKEKTEVVPLNRMALGFFCVCLVFWFNFLFLKYLEAILQCRIVSRLTWKPFCSPQHMCRCSQSTARVRAPLQKDTDNTESISRGRPRAPFCEGTFLGPSSRPGLTHPASLHTRSAPAPGYQNQFLQSETCLVIWFVWVLFVYGIFMSFPGAVDLISAQSNGNSASLRVLSFREAALQKHIHTSRKETPFFMSFPSKEVVIVLK